MESRTAPPPDASTLLALLPGAILLTGAIGLGTRLPSGSQTGLLLGFSAWTAAFVTMARAASGRDGAVVAGAAGGLAAAGLLVSGMLAPERVPLQVLLWTATSGLALVGSVLPWDRIARYPGLAGAAALALLLLPLAAGVEVGGARAWVRWGVLRFQPGEVARVLGLLFLAGALAGAAGGGLPPPGSAPAGRPSRRVALGVGIAWILLTGGWVAQRDLGGAALSYVLFPGVWLLAGGGWALAAMAAALAAGGSLGLIRLFPHALDRLVAWTSPWGHLSTSAYQGLQGLLSLRLGGLWGGSAPAAGALAIPAAATDLPLAALAEATGLLGVWGILYMEWCIVDRALGGARRARETHARLMIGGAALLWGLEVLLPTAGWLGLLPLTGLPLPLVSRGGTALVTHGLLLGWFFWGFRARGEAGRSRA